MFERFSFPTLRHERRTLTVFRTPPPPADVEAVARYAGAFRVRGELRDAGARLVTSDKRGTLEYFRASGSVWWTRTDVRSGEPLDAVLPSEDEALQASRAYLREHLLDDPNLTAPQVGYTMVSRVDPRRLDHDEGEVPAALHVNYRFELDGLPVFGAGAKVQVTFGAPGRPTEALRFWREPVPESQQEVIAPEEAVAMMSRDEAFAQLDGEAVVEFRSVRLGYHARPPREVQPYLTPVYAFSGTVSTRALERYDFVKYVVATREDPAQSKRTRRIYGIPSPIFSG